MSQKIFLAFGGWSAVLAAEPNPPSWPDSVQVFSPSDDSGKIAGAIAAAFAINGGHSPSNHGQFSDKRFAFLFKPGTYDVDAPVGYYTQVLGLGATPSDVTFTGEKGVYSEEGDYSIGGALSSFWRSAENFRTSANNKWATGTGMMWAVSQAAPVRRIEVDNDLILFEYQPPIQAAGESSGGYMANVKVGAALRAGPAHNATLAAEAAALGTVAPGSQQQWFSRDCTVDGVGDGVWNMVFTGVDGAPAAHCGNVGGAPNTVVAQTPTISEKPYVTIGADGKYGLVVPALKSNSHGADHGAADAAAVVGFEHVYVATTADSAAAINAKLGAGLHVVLSPGIYDLEAPLKLGTKGQVLLGLGLATLRPTAATAVIEVGDVDGARVAGVLVQAGPLVGGKRSPALIQWGETGTTFAGSASDPGFLHDVFARVGGPDGTPTSVVGADAMLVVSSGNVVGDNMWLWRADHTAGGAAYPHSGNDCDHGLVVTGDDVTMYGLAVEHTLADLTSWQGEGGRTYFYQSELPYNVEQAEFGDKGYAGYRVAPGVKKHAAWGVGVYCFFESHNVTTTSGIVCPPALESSFTNSLTVKLNGNGGIKHVINDKGGPAVGNLTSVVYVC
jgi:hypothetical protein